MNDLSWSKPPIRLKYRRLCIQSSRYYKPCKFLIRNHQPNSKHYPKTTMWSSYDVIELHWFDLLLRTIWSTVVSSTRSLKTPKLNKNTQQANLNRLWLKNLGYNSISCLLTLQNMPQVSSADVALHPRRRSDEPSRIAAGVAPNYGVRSFDVTPELPGRDLGFWFFFLLGNLIQIKREYKLHYLPNICKIIFLIKFKFLAYIAIMAVDDHAYIFCMNRTHVN